MNCRKECWEWRKMSKINYGDFRPNCKVSVSSLTEPINNPDPIFYLAEAFLSIESMTHKKLQKLCYYAKAWYLALYDENLVDAPFMAWVHGAVQPNLYQKYKAYGFNYIPQVLDTRNIPEEFLNFAKDIYDSYGHLDGDELEKLNHNEAPWIKARGDAKPWQSCNAVISEDDMRTYYRSLLNK